MARPAAVTVHNDLSASQSTVSARSANHEGAGGIHPIFSCGIEQVGRHYRFYDLLNHVFSDLFIAHILCVLGRKHNSVHAGRLSIHVFDANLTLAIRSKIIERPVSSELREFLDEMVSQNYGCRHQFRSLITCVTEHQPLVSCPLLLE